MMISIITRQSSRLIFLSFFYLTFYVKSTADGNSLSSDAYVHNPDVNFTDSKRPRMLNPFDGGGETQHVCLGGGDDELREFVGSVTRVFKNICYKLSKKSNGSIYFTGSKNTPRVVGVHK